MGLGDVWGRKRQDVRTPSLIMNEHRTSLNSTRCIFALVILKKQWPRCPFRCLTPGALSAWYDPHVHASDLEKKEFGAIPRLQMVQIVSNITR